jgi:hypothetical protein
VTCDPDEGDDERVMRAVERVRTAWVSALDRRAHDDPERGEATGWAALAGLATVSTVAMVARYHDLLVATLAKVAETPLDGLPGA